MTNIITQPANQDSSGGLVALLIVVLLIVGLAIAYFNGAFTGSDKTTIIEHKSVNITVHAPAPAPAPAAAPAPKD